jgi:hypothetical protein
MKCTPKSNIKNLSFVNAFFPLNSGFTFYLDKLCFFIYAPFVQRCGIGIMVAHDLAMVETRVRFPYSAPSSELITIVSFCFRKSCTLFINSSSSPQIKNLRGPLKKGKRDKNTYCNLSTLEQINVCLFRLG